MTSDATTFRDAMPTRGEGRSSVVRLRDLVARALGGGTPSTADPSYWDGMIPWTTSAIIGQDDIYLTQYQRRITERGLAESATNIAPKGAVLVGTRVGVGKTAVATFDVAVSQDLTILIPTPQVLPEFLALSLKAPSIQRWFEQNKRGTTIKGVPREDVLSLTIAVPPLAEQRAIADALVVIQRAREAAEAVLAATRELKRSLLRHLFTYGPAPAVTADRVALQETAYGAAPSDWGVLSLGECAEVQSGVTKGRNLSGSATIDLPYLRVANVQDGYLDLSEIKTIRIRADEVERYRLRVGDVLMTEGGDPDKLGRGYVWRGELPLCLHQNHIFAVRPRQGVLDTEYFSFLIQSDYGKRYFLQVAHRTTNLASINLTKLKTLPVLLPPLDVQRTIAGHVNVIDAKIRIEEQRRHALDLLFKSLLDQLMSGNLRVRQPGGSGRNLDERN